MYSEEAGSEKYAADYGWEGTLMGTSHITVKSKDKVLILCFKSFGFYDLFFSELGDNVLFPDGPSK